MRGYYGIGVENIKTEQNLGTLFRSAFVFNANFVFTINKRYKKQASDTYKTYRHIPLFHYDNFDNFYNNLPHGCQLIGLELDERSVKIKEFKHPQNAIYLLGSEDSGLTKKALERCHSVVQIPGVRSLNVATAGSIVMYDRNIKSLVGREELK